MDKILFMDAKVQVIPQSHEAYVTWCDDVVASIKIQIEGQKPIWFSVYQQKDLPCFYLSDEDIFDQLTKRSQFPTLLRNRINCFYGFMLDWYEIVYQCIYRLFDSPYAQVVRLLCYLAREDKVQGDFFTKVNKDRYLGSFEIPTTDFEEMFLTKKLEA